MMDSINITGGGGTAIVVLLLLLLLLTVAIISVGRSVRDVYKEITSRNSISYDTIYIS